MKLRNWLLLIIFSVMANLFIINGCLGKEFPWPLFMGGISQGGKCNGEMSVNNYLASSTYEGRVADYKVRFCKSDEWESWMLANKSRYIHAFEASRNLPSSIIITFRYETTPINYSPAWTSEAEHMSVFTTMAKGAYPNYNFSFVYDGDPNTSYANIIAGTENTTSYAYGKSVYLHFETIFNHEFAHILNLPHHYDSVDTIGDGLHMPPGENQCIMDRNSSLFCSACRTALGITLDHLDTSKMDAATTDILSRYPDDSTGCWLYQC